MPVFYRQESKINRAVGGKLPKQVVAFGAELVNIHGTFACCSGQRRKLVGRQFFFTLVFEDNVKAAFAVENLHAGIAEFNLIVLTGKFGKNSLKVGRFVVFGIGCDFNLFSLSFLELMR